MTRQSSAAMRRVSKRKCTRGRRGAGRLRSGARGSGGESHRRGDDLSRHQLQQHLRVQPGFDGVGPEVGQAVQATERLFALDLQLHLPAQAIKLEHLSRRGPFTRHGREHHHPACRLEHLLGDIATVLAAQPFACLLRLVLGQTQDAEASLKGLFPVRVHPHRPLPHRPGPAKAPRVLQRVEGLAMHIVERERCRGCSAQARPRLPGRGPKGPENWRSHGQRSRAVPPRGGTSARSRHRGRR